MRKQTSEVQGGSFTLRLTVLERLELGQKSSPKSMESDELPVAVSGSQAMYQKHPDASAGFDSSIVPK